jgi:hypothetical protein
MPQGLSVLSSGGELVDRLALTLLKEAGSTISEHTQEYSSISRTAFYDSDVWYNAHK